MAAASVVATLRLPPVGIIDSPLVSGKVSLVSTIFFA